MSRPTLFERLLAKSKADHLPKEPMTEDQAEAVLAASLAPRVTPERIDKVIKDTTFYHHGLLTLAVLDLENGFTVTGESACASPENYNRELGERIAYDNARNKIWALEGYLLKQCLFDPYGERAAQAEARPA